jgi:hypothetical protein
MHDLASQYEQRLRALQERRTNDEQAARGDERNYSLVGLRLVTVLNQLQALQAIQGIQELLPKEKSVRQRLKIPEDAKERAQQRQWLMFKADWLESLLEDSIREIEALDAYERKLRRAMEEASPHNPAPPSPPSS